MHRSGIPVADPSGRRSRTNHCRKPAAPGWLPRTRTSRHLSAAQGSTGGFYIFDTRPCDRQSGAVEARVRFGLPNGHDADGSARMTFCKTETTVLALGPFVK